MSEKEKVEIKDLSPYKSKTDEDLKQIALGIFNGQILTDRHLPLGDTNLLFMVFMPLALSGKSLADWMLENKVNLIYGDIKDSFGRSINGFPVFRSIGFLNEEDNVKMWEKHDKIKAAVEDV
jgi:hypothetical protein